MDLADFGLDSGRRKTLVILGAGASRGASFVTDSTKALPPLDLDFFQQVARMRRTDRTKGLLSFVRSEYGHEVGVSMEQFFSEADYTARFHRELNVDRGPFIRKYSGALEDFMRVLPRLLNETTAEPDGTTPAPCDYHRQLASLLNAQD